jgi:hypothetical protein
MRRLSGAITLTMLVLVAMPLSADDLVSKNYQFKPDTTLEIGAANDRGLRLDSVRFKVPPTTDGRIHRTAGLVTVDVALSNVGTDSNRAGIAIALFDAKSRLVGVASGGSRFSALRAGRQKTYRLVFDDVNGLAHTATTFQVSVESKP